jgi:hypothetical protein
MRLPHDVDCPAQVDTRLLRYGNQGERDEPDKRHNEAVSHSQSFGRWWANLRYERDGVITSWVKIKNPTYTQMTGRRELFENRANHSSPRRSRSVPLLRLQRFSTFRSAWAD